MLYEITMKKTGIKAGLAIDGLVILLLVFYLDKSSDTRPICKYICLHFKAVPSKAGN